MVPYTLPGVLALIGCWWYLSRKKQRSVRHESPEGAPPTAAGLKASLAEGSNGLLESAASPTHVPSKVVEQRAEDGEIARKIKAEQSSEGGPADRRVAVVSEEDARRPACCSASPELHANDARAAEGDLLVGEAAPLRCPSPSATRLPGVERPEPEGEVALLTEDRMLTCALTPPQTEKAVPSEGDSLGSTPSAREFNQHLLTSTPTFGAVQEPAIRPPPPEDQVQVQVCSEEEQNLELLASGLITEVISAATQEVLGVAIGGRPHRSSTPLGAAPPCSQPTAAPPHHRPPNVSQNGCEETDASALPNGCSPLRGRQTNGVRAALDGKLAADEAGAPAEDSACSTCHSEDGVSSEDLQSSANQTDGVQATGCSAAEAARTEAARTEEAAGDDDNAADEIKRLNGLSLRNGGVGNEAETDQSGGETVTSCSEMRGRSCDPASAARPGSDVNSMDSVDSGCTMGATEPPGNHAASSSELIVWEIEVPKVSRSPGPGVGPVN